MGRVKSSLDKTVCCILCSTADDDNARIVAGCVIHIQLAQWTDPLSRAARSDGFGPIMMMVGGVAAFRVSGALFKLEYPSRL